MKIINIKLLSLVSVLCLLMVCLISCDSGSTHSEHATNKIETITGELVNNAPSPDANYGGNVGDICLPMQLETFSGDTYNIAQNRGKVTVLNFWGEWCGYCLVEMPEFDRVAEEYKNELSVVAVHSLSGMDQGIAYVNKNYADSKIIFAKDLSVYGQTYYGMLGGDGSYPRTIIIDKSGAVVFSQYGAMSYDALVEAITPYL
ncbi:MAG: TlpA family protein disulfide reductase [Ruminococcaceae bacterium]|nr:TlpA family protein disulfide reductase [Oscillospiraceae bacterium]